MDEKSNKVKLLVYATKELLNRYTVQPVLVRENHHKPTTLKRSLQKHQLFCIVYHTIVVITTKSFQYWALFLKRSMFF